MSAVAPESALLSPFVGALEAKLRASMEALLGIGDDSIGHLERLGADGLKIVLRDGGEFRLGGLSPSARAAGAQLTVQATGAQSDAAARRTVASALARPSSVLAGLLSAVAEALSAWWPFAGIQDDEYRKISSSPAGPYGTLRLGYRCNQDCWFCWQDRRGPSPPFERYVTWLDELAGLGVSSVNITGGEATTWSRLPELLERASHSHGLSTSIQTNAVRLARPAYLRSLVAAGLDAVMVSLHSADPAVSDAMTRAPGTHGRTVSGVEGALGAGLVATVTCVVEAANVHGLAEHADMVLERFVRPFPDNPLRRVTYAHPTDYFDVGRWAEQQVSFDVLRPALSAAVAALRQEGVPVQVGGPCGFPICALDADLVGDPYQVMERAGFHGDELVHRRYAGACDDCLARTSCFGLREEYLHRFGSLGLRPVTGEMSR